MKPLLTFAVLCLAMLFSAPLQADLIVNGSFEEPDVIDGSFLSFGGGSTFSGWDAVGIDVAIVDQDAMFDGITFQSQLGRQWLDLAGNGSNSMTNGVSQNVNTMIGTEYLLSFWVGSAQNADSANNIFASTVMLSIDGGAPVSFTNTTTPRDMLDWKMSTFSFSALNAVTNIAFFNGSASNNELCGLDNVSLTAVPEPSSISLLSGCLIGLAIFRRRGGLTSGPT